MRREPLPAPRRDHASRLSRRIRLAARCTTLLVVDMQYATASRAQGLGRRLSQEGRAADSAERFERIERVVIPNLKRLLRACRRHGVPVIYLTVGSARRDYGDIPVYLRKAVVAAGNRVGTRANAILDEVKPRSGELVLRKTTMSAFTSTGLEATLRSLGQRCLIFAGVSTNMCVDITARDAADRGFDCVIAEDCCAATKKIYHDAAVVTFQRLFGRVARSDELIAEIVAWST